MSRSSWLGALAALVLVTASVIPAGAQPQLRVVSDSRGLFSISLPSDWNVADSRMSDVVFRGLKKTAIAKRIISTLAAHNAARDGKAPAILAVAAVSLPAPVPALEFGQSFRSAPPPDWAITQDGQATIAGRDAYYIYFTTQKSSLSLYMVMAYFTVGRTGFLVVGGTLNDPEPIRKHFATISTILETFRPSGGLGAFPAR